MPDLWVIIILTLKKVYTRCMPDLWEMIIQTFKNDMQICICIKMSEDFQKMMSEIKLISISGNPRKIPEVLKVRIIITHKSGIHLV